jgi:hypothetical protein
MATAAASQTKHPERTREWDRLFFCGVALLILSAVSVGFAQTYSWLVCSGRNSPT